ALTIGMSSDPDVLDATLARTLDSGQVLIPMCEKLYNMDAHLKIVPQLAAAMPTFSENKKTVTIRLRKGITFNDGTPFNAEAVKQTLERDKTLPASADASDLAPVSSIETDGNSTVVLHLANRFAPLTSVLAYEA